MSDITSLRLTEAHHGDNEFYDLGEITHEVPPHVLFARLPDSLCGNAGGTVPAHTESCLVVDALSSNGDILDDVEITRALAAQLMDRPLDDLLAEARERLAKVYAMLAAR